MCNEYEKTLLTPSKIFLNEPPEQRDFEIICLSSHSGVLTQSDDIVNAVTKELCNRMFSFVFILMAFSTCNEGSPVAE